MNELNQHITNAAPFQQPPADGVPVKDQSANMSFAMDMAQRMAVKPEPGPQAPPLGHMPIAN
jgi:hypothetical protein